jgi:hypothetical protein
MKSPTWFLHLKASLQHHPSLHVILLNGRHSRDSIQNPCILYQPKITKEINKLYMSWSKRKLNLKNKRTEGTCYIGAQKIKPNHEKKIVCTNVISQDCGHSLKMFDF